MSGPKIVRFVPLPEARTSWRVWIEQARARLTSWEKHCERLRLLSDSERKENRDRLEKLVLMVEADDFQGLVADGESFLKYLSADLEFKVEEAARREVFRNKALESATHSAKMLLRLASENGIALSQRTAGILQRAVDRPIVEIEVLEQAILQAASLIMSSGSGKIDRDLRSTVAVEHVNTWLDRNGYRDAESSMDAELLSIDMLLHQLEGLGRESEVPEFQSRVSDVTRRYSGSQRRLAMQALTQEIQSVLTTARIWSDLQQQFDDLMIEAEVEGDILAIEAEVEAFQRAWSARNETAARTALAGQRKLLDAEKHSRFAEQRRNDLLNGLARLGYRVSEGLSKIWAAEKQIVIRKAGESETGLELSGDLSLSRCQMRVVLLDDSGKDPSTVDGKAAEDSWCSQLERLQKELETAGASLVIERATASGSVPLKVARSTWVPDFEGAGTDSEIVVGRRREQSRGQ